MEEGRKQIRLAETLSHCSLFSATFPWLHSYYIWEMNRSQVTRSKCKTSFVTADMLWLHLVWGLIFDLIWSSNGYIIWSSFISFNAILWHLKKRNSLMDETVFVVLSKCLVFEQLAHQCSVKYQPENASTLDGYIWGIWWKKAISVNPSSIFVPYHCYSLFHY